MTVELIYPHDLLFKAIGALGIILITAGILNKDKFRGTLLYLFGGICLEIYSIYIWDEVFIILQAVFTIAVIYKLFKLKQEKKQK